MHPAFSVIFLTTLCGAGQGLLLALYGAELAAAFEGRALAELRPFLLAGGLLVLALSVLGLIASFFHLGHPERAWRAAAGWRTSWLSREVIALPAFMGAALLYTWGHYAGGGVPTLLLGGAATALAFVLFVCTGMIYASIKVIREWASPLTVVNYTLLGSASGLTLACALAAVLAPAELARFAPAALLLTVAAAATRIASLARNAHLKPKATLQSAIGIRHPRIVQKAQGAMGGSFNTREFFHGATPGRVRAIRRAFLALAFAAPLLLIGAGVAAHSAALMWLAFGVQYLGLIAERWVFFAQANHPQNLYYQAIA